ncbi:MAG: RNA polymerase factor sigma-54 [Mariprofundaceae bacterium]|nr:RNA polymerase factor sigma-54 [Mariprofundaceae bacterium]
MALSLSYQQKQKLYLGQSFQQSLKLLSMDHILLETFVSESLLENPCLERDEEYREHLEIPGSSEEKTLFSDDIGGASSRISHDLESQLSAQESLNAVLKKQVNCMQVSQVERDIAIVIIDALESNGYLHEAIDFLAHQLACTAKHVESVLVDIVQQLEPVGVGSRDLKEYLLLQLDDTPIDRMVKACLQHHVTFLTEEDHTLAKESGYSLTQIQQLRSRIRRLQPSPAGGLYAEDDVYVKADIYFSVLKNGEVEVDVPDPVGKSLILNHRWQQHVWKGDEKEFMNHAWNNARSLIHALSQRRQTMFKLGSFLAHYQKDFILNGVMALKPLTMAYVAQEVGLHESTISRVVSQKYAQTPLGLIHLKCFFSSGLGTLGGENISIHCVKQRIKALISVENNAKPISDQKITLQLKSEGIEIARRTVAKYRESLGIPTSTKRRQ